MEKGYKILYGEDLINQPFKCWLYNKNTKCCVYINFEIINPKEF